MKKKFTIIGTLPCIISILPFNTHDGNGFAGTADKIQNVVPDTVVL